MSKNLKMVIGAINIKIHPHSPEMYIELFKDAIALKSIVPIRGAIHGSLSKFNYLDPKDKTRGFKGNIYKFLNIDPNQPWFDVENEKVADTEVLKGISAIKNMKPNLSSFMYYFAPLKHRIFFTTYYDKKGISAKSIGNFFTNLFYEPSIIEKYGEVEVIIEPSTDKLDKIMKMSKIDKLELVISRPNPDDHGEAERKLLERLGRLNAKKLSEQYESISHETLKPDSDLLVLSKIAASNGYVKASGRDDSGKKIYESTLAHPLEESAWYTDNENPNDIFVLSSNKILDSI